MLLMRDVASSAVSFSLKERSSRCEAMELVLPSRGSGQPEQLSGCLPSEDRNIMALILPLLFPKKRLA